MAAADDAFGLFERTMAGYEEEVSRTREEEDERHRQQIGPCTLSPVDKTQAVLDIEDVQQRGRQEECPLQLQWQSSALKQEDPQPPHVKEEEEELGITQEGECLLGPEDASLTKLQPTGVSVKTEDHEDKPPESSQLHHSPNVQQLTGHREEHAPQLQVGSFTVKQENAQPPHVKEEEEELWTTRKQESLLGSEEADLTKLPLTVVSVKAEDLEEKPQADNLLAPLSDSDDTTSHSPEDEGRDDSHEALSSGTDCEGDMRTHADNKHSEHWKEQTRFTCSVCGEPYSYKSDLTHHMRMHPEGKLFSCSICGKRFSRKSVLVTHTKTHLAEKPFSCSVCGKGFAQNGVLVAHKRTHTGEKPFRCSVCGKRFSRHSGVVSHMRTHTGEKPFSCSVCGDSFSRKRNVTQHMRTHTGERPYSCSVCGKRFSQRSNLVAHTRIHTGEKPFICLICGESFVDKVTLIAHKRIHTGEKPFNCPVCAKSYSYKRDLTAHVRTHTGEKPFSCSDCGKSYFYKRSLTAHMQTHSGE
ncbi:zinc finger protein 391-like isoform X2 [Dunckerocampus dactyliophorus]|uniref:zinc finger protein 391-like isoform X2 n=1 Tax=Dunckerocampus dactyliophorus TaxID=161453 RepID=UPI0024052140|nr:zinc finger protein 391-like isoform X2 [Dunckerocampus dactyliophorus]